VSSVAIVGAGISGLSTAFYLDRQNKDIEITIFDKNQTVGGVIKTDQIAGYVLEAGPDSFLTQKRAAFELSEDLGLTNELIGSRDQLRKTFIFHEGKLKLLPEGMFLMVPASLKSFLRSDLISWYGKFSALKDLFTLPDKEDISVADWVEKRFGTEVLQQIAEPLLAGIYGGDSNRLSLSSALPQLWELQKNGSVILQSIERKSVHQSLFTSYRKGIQTLIHALLTKLQHHTLQFGEAVNQIVKRDKKWWIQDRAYDAVVLAASTAPEIISPDGFEIRGLINSVRKNSAIVIVLAFRGVVREGFGWLVPRSEREFALACTYISNKFAERCPPDHLLLRVFVGGSHAEHSLNRSDDELIERAMHDLNRIAGIKESPVLSRVYRWPSAMPEYAVGHQNTIKAIGILTEREGSIFVANNLMGGVGIPDCILQGRKISECLTKKN
jgi:oxygen-dependent protoporphyrinogen oxidase